MHIFLIKFVFLFQVAANPSADLKFRWIFNTTAEKIDIQVGRYPVRQSFMVRRLNKKLCEEERIFYSSFEI